MFTELQSASGGGGGSYSKAGIMTVPNNTTDTVTINFDSPITQFVAVSPAAGSGKYIQGLITLNKSISGLSNAFKFNWYSQVNNTGHDAGLTLSSDGKTMTIQQPANYYAGDYVYCAWAE